MRPRSPSRAFVVVLVLATAWALFVGSLAVARHDNLRTNAFDLGYISQTLWNTVHGEPFRLTVLEGASFQPEGLDPTRIRSPHSYLAFHVEPIDLLLAPVYGVWPDPRLLLWLQAIVVAAGALPAAWLGRRVVGGEVAAIAFGAAYLLAPGLQGAALSDFHAVALAATWLMAGLWLLEAGRARWALALLALTAGSREDAALVVACLGVVLVLRGLPPPLSRWDRTTCFRGKSGPAWLGVAETPSPWPAHATRERVPGGAHSPRGRGDASARHWYGTNDLPLRIAIPAALWTVACFGVIAPYFNGGGSLFWSRYAWLGPTPARAALNLLRDPLPLVGWFAQSDVASYLAIQLLTGGLICLLAPLELLAAAPLLVLNALSSFDWMRSGGAHYSALLVPVLLWAAAHGARNCLWPGGRLGQGSLSLWERVRVRAQCGVRGPGDPTLHQATPSPQPSPTGRRGKALSLVVFLAALGAQSWIGVSPLHPGFAWPSPDPRAAVVLSQLKAIPADAAVSASSATFAHLSSRQRIYWFPALEGADWVAVDVAGTTHPLDARGTRDAVADLLASGDYGLVAAGDGLLILRRGAAGTLPGGVFVAAVRAPGSDPEAGRPGDLPKRVAAALPEGFFGFARAQSNSLPAGAAPLRFGTSVVLVGHRLRRWPEVSLFGDSATLETFWRVDAPVPDDLTFVLATTRRSDGAIVGLQPDLAATPLWYPTSRWRPGEVIRLEMPIDRLTELRALGVAVLDPAGQRLAVAGEPGAVLWENGTIARVVEIP